MNSQDANIQVIFLSFLYYKRNIEFISICTSQEHSLEVTFLYCTLHFIEDHMLFPFAKYCLVHSYYYVQHEYYSDSGRLHLVPGVFSVVCSKLWRNGIVELLLGKKTPNVSHLTNTQHCIEASHSLQNNTILLQRNNI